MAWWINNAQDEDLSALLSIEAEAFFPPWSRELLARELRLPQSRFRVMRCRDPFSSAPEQICGFCVSWVVGAELHLLQIAVAIPYRRQGLGRHLLQDTIEIARAEGAQQIVLEVRASNQPALQLYRQFEFREVGIRRDYYNHPPEDAIVLIKENIVPSLLRPPRNGHPR